MGAREKYKCVTSKQASQRANSHEWRLSISPIQRLTPKRQGPGMREYHTAGESVIFEQRYLEALIWTDMS